MNSDVRLPQQSDANQAFGISARVDGLKLITADLSLFPQELWIALGHAPARRKKATRKKCALKALTTVPTSVEPTPDELELHGEAKSGDEDEASGSEVMDDQYDDEDDGGDYDAEQYFDDGGEDGGEEFEGGGQGADYYD